MSDRDLQFVQLLTSHQPRLYAYVLSLIGDANAAQDVMQETNTIIWSKSKEFEMGTNFSAWMLKIAKFQVMAWRKKESRERLIFDDELTAKLASMSEARVERGEERRVLLSKCMSRLTEKHRDLIRARYEQGWDLATLAESMNQNKNSVKQMLFRARAALVDCVRYRMSESALTESDA